MKKIKFLVCFFFLVLFPSFLFGDTIRLKEGPPIRDVIVVRETAKEIKYRYKGSSLQTKASEQVAEIIFDPPNRNLATGISHFKGKKYSSAVRFFESVRGEKFRSYGRYYLGETFRRMGNFRQAIQVLKEFESIDHRLAPKALYGLGQLYLQQKDYHSASEIFKKIVGKKYSKYWSLQALYGEASALLRQGKFSNAKSKFAQVYSKSRSGREVVYQELAGLAEQGKGLAMVGAGDFSGAKRLFVKIIKSKNATSEALAGSYLGLGKVYFNMAKKGRKSKDNYEKALLCFLRVAMFFNGYKSKYVEALQMGAKCFEKLGQDGRAGQLRNRIPR